MNFLLDTHALIWAISEKSKLSLSVRQILDDSNNTIFVSAISFWEISMKFSVGKLYIEGILPEELPPLSLKTGFQLIPLSPEESSSYNKLPITTHRDPFDRMLIWQAIYRDLMFISKDENMKLYGSAGLKTIW